MSINLDASAARETARRTDGKFGTQQLTEAALFADLAPASNRWLPSDEARKGDPDAPVASQVGAHLDLAGVFDVVEVDLTEDGRHVLRFQADVDPADEIERQALAQLGIDESSSAADECHERVLDLVAEHRESIATAFARRFGANVGYDADGSAVTMIVSVEVPGAATLSHAVAVAAEDPRVVETTRSFDEQQFGEQLVDAVADEVANKQPWLHSIAPARRGEAFLDDAFTY